jgi:hypothetical protein
VSKRHARALHAYAALAIAVAALAPSLAQINVPASTIPGVVALVIVLIGR